LNDQWASHATWESEESGFVAHKKTAYEESLSRIEEERHDYDSNIEVLDRTIQLLEPINKALDGMSLDAKKAYKIDMRLGGQSELLWKRVTFKLYGRESGQKVIESLEQSPYIVVPVLLQRFLTVREVWKSAQRHWQSVWRQQMNQFYHKSLDPQGANGKAASDKKQFTEKSLTGDIKIRYEDTKFHKARAEEQRRLQLREAAGNNGDVRRTSIPKVKDYQYLHKMENTPVVLDAARLVLTFMDHTYSADHPRLLIEMKDFLSLFFGIDRSLFKSALEDGDSPNSESSPAAESADSARPKKKGKNRLLKSALVQAGASASASASRDVTPGPASAPEEDATSANAEGSDAEKWFTAPAPVVVSGRAISFDEQFPRTEYHMYCNIPIYCFLHLLGTIYERLLLLLEYEDEVKAMAEMQKAPKAAHALDMIDATPDDFFRDTSSTANYYKQMLLLFEDHLRGSIDQTVVEDTLRRYYLPNGWRLYFIYYQIQSMAKFAFNFGGPDPKGRERTFEIIQLFKRNRVKEKTSLHDDLSYRQQVSKHLNVKEKETDLSYRITYVRLSSNYANSTMLIQSIERASKANDYQSL
jgi:paired amphipathic helix protein Sin3a